jgi:hypothetical protein
VAPEGETDDEQRGQGAVRFQQQVLTHQPLGISTGSSDRR